MSSSSIAEAPVPSASHSKATLSSPAPVADDTRSQPTAPTSPPPSLPQPSLPSPPPPTPTAPPPTPIAPPQVVGSPPTASEPPLKSPPLPPPVTPTQPVISPPSPIIRTPSLSPPPPPRQSATGPPPSATPFHPIVPPPLPPQPAKPKPKSKPRPLPPSLTLPSPPSPTETSPSPPISPLPPETSFPPPPATPLRPTLSTRPTSAFPLLPITPSVPPLPKSNLAPLSSSPSGLPQPSALASPPPPLASPQGPKFLTYGPAPLPLVNQNLIAKPGTGRLHISAGLALGGAIAVILLAIIVLGLFFFRYRYRRKEKDVPSEDHYKLQCLAKEGNCCPVAPKLPEKNVLPPWQQKLKASSNPCSPLPRVSSRESSDSISLGSENPIPPQAPGAALSHSRGTFTYNQLVSATDGFSESNLLGEGGFGYVHKGILPSGQEIAVKQLKKDGGQGEREFQAEIETISRVHHKHLVSLVGYCVTGPERLLVYEFLPNKTLEFHLHGEGQPVIEWAARMRIAIGSAKGIAYLHEDCKPAIIHRDIKASNILLDFRFEAKVSDFGLAKIFSETNISHISTRVVGTFGYLAPEYASSGKVTEKSDVYSYGVMLLELITGCPPISKTDTKNEGLVGWARPLLSQALEDGEFDGLVDPRLLGNYNTSEMTRMVACAAACVRHSAWLRPRLSQIVHALEGHVSLTALDEGMPAGHSGIYLCLGSSNFDAQKCTEDMKKFNIALESEGYGISKCSESTSEYGLNPSCSSSEFHHNQRSR